MMGRLLALATLLPMVSGAALEVVFPAERQRFEAIGETYLIGSVQPVEGAALLVNGVTTSVYRTGAFIQMVSLVVGTNRVVVARGAEKVERTVIVTPPPKSAPKPHATVDADDSPLLSRSACWRTTGSIFANRVRTLIDDGDTLCHLPRGFELCCAEVKGESWLCVWLEGRRGFLPRSLVKKVPERKTPARSQPMPDLRQGFPATPPRGKSPAEVCVMVDPGHGGSDSGARTPRGWKEKDVNLMQALAIRDSLREAGFKVLMTREDDSFPPLYSRPQLAYDRKVDAFISVHHNATAANRDPRLVRHTTTYASTTNGLALASCVQAQIGKVLEGVCNNGAQLRSYAVCRNPVVPSCLIEVDFINFPEGEEQSWNVLRQHKVAEAVAQGVLDWIRQM